MRDTTAEIEARYQGLLMALSGEERVMMAGRMFDSARTLVRAGLEASLGVAGDSREAKVALFLRLYGADFDPETRSRYARRLGGG